MTTVFFRREQAVKQIYIFNKGIQCIKELFEFFPRKYIY